MMSLASAIDTALEARVEVTQPRVTCYRVGIRMAEPAMAALLVSHHRPGFYFRVLEEGEVGAGDELLFVLEWIRLRYGVGQGIKAISGTGAGVVHTQRKRHDLLGCNSV